MPGTPAGHQRCRVTTPSPRAEVSRAMVSEIRRRSIEPARRRFDPKYPLQRFARATVRVRFVHERHWRAQGCRRTRSCRRTKTNRRRLRRPTRGAQRLARGSVWLTGYGCFSNSRSGSKPLKRKPRAQGETWVGSTAALPVRERQRPAMAWQSRRGGGVGLAAKLVIG